MTQLTINTTQNVSINFTAASIGERILAFLTDFLIMIAYMIVVFWLVFNVLGVGQATANWNQWSVIALSMVIQLPVMFYSLIFESIFEGQSLGKRLLKIKVVKIDGYQASFGDYLIRWLFRLVDIFTNFGIIGLAAIVSTEKSQRLGDITAGTAVISLKTKISIDSTILQNVEDDYVPVYPLVIKLSDNDVRIIKENFEAALARHDYPLLEKLSQKIETVTGIKNQAESKQQFIRTVLKDYNHYTQNM